MPVLNSDPAPSWIDKHSMLRLGLIVLAYAAAHKLAYLFLDPSGILAAIWPAAGIALAALLVTPQNLWPRVLAALGVINLVANLAVGKTFAISLAFVTMNLTEAFLDAWMIYYWCGNRVRFARVGEVTALIGVATVVNAGIGFISLKGITMISGDSFWNFYRTWWISNALGILLVTPLLVTWMTDWNSFSAVRWSRCVEALALVTAWGLAAWIIFAGTAADLPIIPRSYVFFALIAWAALRFGPRGATLILALFTMVAIYCTLAGIGVFPMGGKTATDHLLMIQMFLCVLGITGLLLAASRAEQHAARQSLGFSEEALKRSVSLLRATLESTADGILVVDLRGKITDFNDQFVKLWRLPEPILASRDDEKALAFVLDQLRYPENFLAKVRDLRAHPEAESFDVLEFKDGRVVERYSHAQRIEGRPVGRVWSFRDVTKREEAEEHVREQARLLDLAHDAILVRDLEGHIQYWNKSAERLYGWSASEVLGKTPTQFLPRSIAGYAEANKTVREKGRWKGELVIPGKFGQEVLVEARWTLVRDLDGTPKSILAINTDITERKKLEAQLLRSQRMESVGTLAGGIAHDLNNVLTPLLIAVQLLKGKITDTDRQKLLETLEANVQRGSNLVKQVLAFGRGIDGERAVIHPADVANEIKQIVHETFPKSVDFEFRSPPDLWTVTGDSTQLHQVLLNLCVNARDAMPHGGQLSVRMENVRLDKGGPGMNLEAKTGPYVAIHVADNGVGIPKEIQDRIFEPFFTTKESGKGTGLGLSTTLGIVKSHGGFIDCHSTPGKGSTFSVYLPANTASTEGTATAVAQSNLPRGHDELILVVDDEKPIREIAQRTLELFGYRVLVATNGAEAVTLFKQCHQDIAVIITDMTMPIMDGIAAISVFRSIDPRVKIIGSSGLVSHGNASRAVETGIQHFITKPYTTEAILHTLHKVLRDGELK